jgi:hypothetical protein
VFNSGTPNLSIKKLPKNGKDLDISSKDHTKLKYLQKKEKNKKASETKNNFILTCKLV